MARRKAITILDTVVVFLMHGKAQQPEKGDHFSQDTRARVANRRSWFDGLVPAAAFAALRSMVECMDRLRRVPTNLRSSHGDDQFGLIKK